MDRLRVALNLPCGIACLAREPEADAAIPGGKRNENARLRAGAQHEVRRNGPPPEEVIENPAFPDLEGELRGRGEHRRRGQKEADDKTCGDCRAQRHGSSRMHSHGRSVLYRLCGESATYSLFSCPRHARGSPRGT
jgi:hypothetical protein